jgi:hypothetical protein
MAMSNEALALALLADATAEAAQTQGRQARDERVEAAQSRVRQAASSRGEGDTFAAFVAAALAVTVLGPFLIGHLLMVKTFVLKPDPGVYNQTIRGIGDHFFAIYLGGLVPIVLLLGIFLVARTPWEYRRAAVIGGWLAIAGTLVFLIPMAQSKWHAAEEKSMAKLRDSSFPFSSQYLTCASWTVAAENGAKDPELWQVYLAQRQNSGVRGCNRVEVYRGWQFVGQYDLPDGNTFTTTVEVNYPGWNKPFRQQGSGTIVAEFTSTGQTYAMNPVCTNIALATANGLTLEFSLDGAGSNGFNLH